MPILISLAALLLPVVLLQLSSGGVGPLDALSGFELNFTTAQIGALRSAHFVGFFIGCWWSPRLFGLVTLAFRSLNSFMRPFVQMPRGFFHLATSAVVVDYKNH